MDVSRGVAYGLGLSQALVTVGVVVFSPGLEVHAFVPRGAVRNGTVTVPDPVSYQLGIAPLVLASSALAALFSMHTCGLYTEDLTGQDFLAETVDQVGMWDVVFWLYVLFTHGVLALVLGNPCDAFCCLSATCFMAYFLYRACAPKGHQVHLTQENLNILGYCVGAFQIGSQIGDNGNGMTVLMFIVVLDYFLGIGHTWDRQATLNTVVNCRLFYIVCCSLGLAGVYVTWRR